jgi:Tfp pilus assembly protein PilF
MDLQDMGAAEQDMRAYLKVRPDDATAHYGLGRILQMMQHTAAAKDEFERSIALAPNQAESDYQIGQMALDHGDYRSPAGTPQSPRTRSQTRRRSDWSWTSRPFA